MINSNELPDIGEFVKLLSSQEMDEKIQSVLSFLDKERQSILQDPTKDEKFKKAFYVAFSVLVISSLATAMGDNLAAKCNFLEVVKGFIINMELTPLADQSNKVN